MRLLFLIIVFLSVSQLMADPIISEFLASNDSELADEDGDFSDWIEIHNPDATAVDLTGWHLTDSATKLDKWTFPSVSVPAGGYLVVFASDKDRAVVGQELHTGFKLSSGGEYLALVRPDGISVVTEFDPFPAQSEDVSFGLNNRVVLVSEAAPLSYQLIEPSADAQGKWWTEHDFDDSQWSGGSAGIGYDNNADYLPLMNTLVPSGTINTWVRFPFFVEDVAALNGLLLQLRYDDGIEIYLNGTLVTSVNVTEPVQYGESHDWVDFDLTSHLQTLREGNNVLAIRLVNDSTTSSDMLLVPNLVATSLQFDSENYTYFTNPSPGTGNVSGVLNPGPIISEVTENPTAPSDEEDLLVTARVQARSNTAVGSVILRYRVNFADDVSLAMRDDGAAGDVAAGDGIFSALIPAAVSGPGDMLRWTVEAQDIGARESRMPLQVDTSGSNQSPEYYGTVIAGSNITTTLPVFHRFVQDTSAMDTDAGTRGSLYYNGRFYDNLFMRIRGNTSTNYVKKSHKIDFNDGFPFHLSESRPTVTEINLNTTYTDKSYNRAVLAASMHHLSGLPTPDMFHVYQRLNGYFYNVAIYAEQIDKTFIERQGINADGALYKSDSKTGLGGLGSTNGFTKKTRKTEDDSDLQALVDALDLDTDAREKWLFDNVDIACVVNWWAGVVVSQNIDATDKNYYLYRDSDGTGEWQVFPWDLDLTFGTRQLNSDPIYYNLSDVSIPRCPSSPFVGARPFEVHNNKRNYLLEAMASSPRMRKMLTRRIRTLTDQFLANNWFADRIDAFVPQLQSAVDEDHSKWGGNSHFNWSGDGIYTLTQANNRIKNEYLTPRLDYLTVTHGGEETLSWTTGDGSAGIPSSQSANPSVVLAEIVYNPASGDQDEEYIELQNNGDTAVDLSGWSLSGGVTLSFKGGTVLPAGGSLYLSPDRKVFRQRASGPTGGEGLQIAGDYSGHLGNFGETLVLTNSAGSVVAQTSTPTAPSPAQEYLVVSQFHYQSLAHADAEFIEITNISSTRTVSLVGVDFSKGVEFNFTDSSITSLGPGEKVLVVKNQTAFESVYGTSVSSRIAGTFTGALDNSGETIKLEDASNSTIHEFSYSPTTPWPVTMGKSLVLIDPTSRPDHDLPTSWALHPSAEGSPAGAQPTFTAWLASRGQTDPLADPDADGWSELLTYSLGRDLAGMDFIYRHGVDVIDSEGTDQSYLTLETTVRDGVTPVFQMSHSLSGWVDAILETDVRLVSDTSHGDGTRTLKYRLLSPISESSPRVFLRLKIQP